MSSFCMHIPLAPTCCRSWKSKNKSKHENASRATNLSKAPALAKVCFPSVPIFLCSSWSCCCQRRQWDAGAGTALFLSFLSILFTRSDYTLPAQHPCSGESLGYLLALKPEEKLLLLPETSLKGEQIVIYKSLLCGTKLGPAEEAVGCTSSPWHIVSVACMQLAGQSQASYAARTPSCSGALCPLPTTCLVTAVILRVTNLDRTRSRTGGRRELYSRPSPVCPGVYQLTPRYLRRAMHTGKS